MIHLKITFGVPESLDLILETAEFLLRLSRGPLMTILFFQRVLFHRLDDAFQHSDLLGATTFSENGQLVRQLCEIGDQVSVKKTISRH